MARWLPPPGVAVTVVAVTALLAGCGPPPDLAPTPEVPLPGPTTPSIPTQPAPSPPAPAPSAVDTSIAVDCGGQPGDRQVLSLLRSEGLLPNGAEAAVADGPLCAGEWQFTVVTVPERDPLQVITSGPPDGLTLVTAGTDVCTIEVLVHAPRGIQSAAGCVG